MATTATRKTKAVPEPDGPRVAWCKNCEEQIKQERRGVPWYHADTPGYDGQTLCDPS